MNSTIEHDGVSNESYQGELAPGTMLLHGQYRIDSFLNSGGFGITYLASDSLDRKVVIKECFPSSYVFRDDTVVRARTQSREKDFRAIVSHFVEEARRLSKLKHPNIVGVHQIFEDNDTAYMALDFVDGQDLFDIIDEKKVQLEPNDVQEMLSKMLDAMDFIHRQNILHRDIAPDNILLDQTGNPVLIDFGAARERTTKTNPGLKTLLVVKDGYSPIEFYSAGSEQGPFSDVYGLGATFYHLITGQAPPTSEDRLAEVSANKRDPYQSLLTYEDYDQDFLSSIDRALNLYPEDRIQNARDWIYAINSKERRKAAIARAAKDKTTDLTISKLVTETNQKVLEAIEHDANVLKNQDALIDQSAGIIPTAKTQNAPRRWIFKGSSEKQSARRFWNFG